MELTQLQIDLIKSVAGLSIAGIMIASVIFITGKTIELVLEKYIWSK